LIIKIGTYKTMEDINKQEEYEIIRERIKTRPINQKKLFRRTMITVAMAVIFGVFACITFLVLEPVFSNLLTPEEEATANDVVIPLEEEETLPQDMLLEDEEVDRTPIIIREEVGSNTTAIQDYSNLYNEMYDLVGSVKKSLVTVTGVSQDVDWFNNEYEKKGVTTGFIVASNNIELLILTESRVITDSENINITFFNGYITEGTVKGTDRNTGLAVISVPKTKLTKVLLDEKLIAQLGTSRTSRLLAAPVIAMGRPLGNIDSVEYGMVTSKNNIMHLADNNYEILTTDLHGNEFSSGVLINMSGEIVGFIYQNSPFSDDTTISALGITDIKKTIERMSNGKSRAYLGVMGTDVIFDAINQGMPAGAYITGIDMDSPAMKAGIQNGDVVTQVDGYDITTFSVLTEAILLHEPGDIISITIRRLSGEEYRDVTIEVQLDEM